MNFRALRLAIMISIGSAPLWASGEEASATEVSTEEPAPEKSCRPVVHTRYPPYAPPSCHNVTGDDHYVKIRFDITEYGETTNIRVIEFSDACFVEVSKKQVSRWSYNCKEANKTDVDTTITFNRE